MKKLIRYANYLLSAAVLGATAFVAINFLKPPNWKLSAVVFLFFTQTVLFFWGKTKKNIASGQLIMENRILHIQPVIFEERRVDKTGSLQLCESIEVFISCFGILIDSKIIKFNQGDIRLKAVEFEKDSILLTYGTDRKTQKTKLLYAVKNEDTLAELARKFQYETGIIPTFIQ